MSSRKVTDRLRCCGEPAGGGRGHVQGDFRARGRGRSIRHGWSVCVSWRDKGYVGEEKNVGEGHLDNAAAPVDDVARWGTPLCTWHPPHRPTGKAAKARRGPPAQYLNERFVCDPATRSACVDLCPAAKASKQARRLQSRCIGVYVWSINVLVKLGAVVVGTASLAHALHDLVLRSVSLAASEPRRPPFQ